MWQGRMWLMLMVMALALGARAGWCAAADGPSGAAAATQPAPRELDLTGFDADGLRLLATTLYKSLDESRLTMAELRQQVAQLKAENARLQAELRRGDSRGDGSGGGAGLRRGDPRPAGDTASTGSAAAASDPVRGASTTPPVVTPGIEKRVREQATDFRQLNAAPQNYLAKPLTLLGYAEPTDHHSEGWMNDAGTPRRFLAIKDHRGECIYLSFPVEGNSDLLKLLNGVNNSRRLALRCEVSGISTRQGATFEGALRRWETLRE